MSKQSAQDCYVTDIISQLLAARLDCHTSLGKWVYTASPQLLPESAVAKSLSAVQQDIPCRAVDANSMTQSVVSVAACGSEGREFDAPLCSSCSARHDGLSS